MDDRHPGAADPFRPPDIPTEVGCVQCGRTYESYLIEWRDDPGPNGTWCCPTPGCGGAGFLSDIFPTDPDWRDENGNKVDVFDDDPEEDSADDSGEDRWDDDPEDGECDDDEEDWNEFVAEEDEADLWKLEPDVPAGGDDSKDPTRNSQDFGFDEDDTPF